MCWYAFEHAKITPTQRQTHKHTHAHTSRFCMQNPSNTGGLLRHLNVWFPGEFRSNKDPPLHARNDTTVVQATHKVSSMLV